MGRTGGQYYLFYAGGPLGHDRNTIYDQAYAPNLIALDKGMRMYYVHKPPTKKPWEVHLATSQPWESGALFYPYVIPRA